MDGIVGMSSCIARRRPRIVKNMVQGTRELNKKKILRSGPDNQVK